MSSPHPTVSADARLLLRSILQRIATGPALSKDISRDETREATRLILDGAADPVQAGIFLIALRMKRETDEETLGVLEAIRDVTETVVAPVDEVVALADPYDGFNRTLPATPFLPAVLAACGVAAVSEGVEQMGPKYGLTHHQVMRAAGVPVNLSPREAAARLANPDIGWAYVDQSCFSPKLNALKDLRSLIVKRPALTTVEVLTGPVRGRRHTHLVTGYVHKPYPRLYALLARNTGFHSCLLVRGVEGGIMPSLRQAGKCIYYHDLGSEQDLDINPLELGIKQTVRAAPIPEGLPENPQAGDAIAIKVEMQAFADAAVTAGQAALNGEAGLAQDGLIYTGALVLHHLGRADNLPEAADSIREAIHSGRARAHFQAAVS